MGTSASPLRVALTLMLGVDSDEFDEPTFCRTRVSNDTDHKADGAVCVPSNQSQGRIEIIILPLPIVGLDSCPVRVLGIEDKNA